MLTSNLIEVITTPIPTPALDKICYAFVVVDYSTQGESPWVRPVCEGDACLDGQTRALVQQCGVMWSARAWFIVNVDYWNSVSSTHKAQ